MGKEVSFGFWSSSEFNPFLALCHEVVPHIFTSKYSKPVSSLSSNRAPCAEGAELRDGEWLWDPSVNTLQPGNNAAVVQTQK